ncbi:MAG TPA: glycosyltransferase [Candidatus Dormibacteraeota bacterium]
MAGAQLLKAVRLRSYDLGRFETILPQREFADLVRQAEAGRRLLRGRTVWNVNSTARGGGVAEMLGPLLGYARGAGVDGRWLVVGGEPDFFRVTKRLHNQLHGAKGDGRGLGPTAALVYRRLTQRAAEQLTSRLRPDDVVILHDPQTAGMLPLVKAAGVTAVWRCHVGIDKPNAVARSAIDFLRPYLEHADAIVFSRAAFAWKGLDKNRTWIIQPSLDAFSPKNEVLDRDQVAAILAAAGVVSEGGSGEPTFTRSDGRRGRVRRKARLTEERSLGPRDPYVLQVSRWDSLKDPVGVLRGYARYIAPRQPAHLVLAGPVSGRVADDPEDVRVFGQVRAAWRRLPADARSRVHLVELPMTDVEENAAIINALQRAAAIVVQKSLAEGFGLTVAEAMWKSRPVVASRVGGIEDQIIDGETGLLVNPKDLAEFGRAVAGLLADRRRAEKMGAAAMRRVRSAYLAPRHLLQHLALLEELLGA